MDTQDVSDVDTYVKFLSQIKARAEIALRRQGEKPHDFPPPQLVISRFLLSRLAGIQAAGQRGASLFTSQVPPSYPPSVVPLDSLQPLMISKMMLERHHRGNFTVLRVMTPPDRMTAVMAIVEDEEKTAVLLQLYNQPEKHIVSQEDILRENTICIVKEPYFKATTDGAYSIRIDHVSDLIFLQDGDSRIPLKWRNMPITPNESSEQIRQKGNTAVHGKHWAKAECLYTQALIAAQSDSEKQLALCNRSLTNLRLDRPEKALSDATVANKNEKALFRTANALYYLQRFEDCLEKLVELVRLNPQNTNAWSDIKRVKQRLHEKQTGVYSYGSMYKQAERTPPLIDCATYTGPVMIKSSPNRGNGVFTTKAVVAGELLFCEKAFAYSYAGDDSDVGKANITILMDLSSNRMTIGGQPHLINQIVQKLYHNPSTMQAFTSLHHGNYTPVTETFVDQTPIVDTFLVAKTIQLNCFGAPRTTHALLVSKETANAHVKAHTTCGIWTFASRINHSCFPNCHRTFIGDMMIVRTCRNLDADTELVFPYLIPDDHPTYNDVQKKLEGWDFVCDCVTCVEKKATPAATRKRRDELISQLKQAWDPKTRPKKLQKIKRIIDQLEKTYSGQNNPTAAPLRSCLWDPCFGLGAMLIGDGEFREGVIFLLRGLEALGYIIEAYPPERNQEGAKEPVLEVRQWGIPNDAVAAAFSHMAHAYDVIAPQLVLKAQQYMEIAYSILHGQTETMNTAAR